MNDAVWDLLAKFGYFVAAIAALTLAGWMIPQRARDSGRRRPIGHVVMALTITSGWAVTVLVLGPDALTTHALDSLSHLGWLWALYRMFAHDQRDKSVAPIRPVVLVLAFVQFLQLGLLFLGQRYLAIEAVEYLLFRFEITLSLLFCIGALVLVHNLYAGAANPAREALRWPAAALATLWLYDLNLSTVAYLNDAQPQLLADLRSVAVIAMVALLAVGALRKESTLRFKPSRSFAFQSFSLLVIGAYLVLMVLVAQGLAYFGSDVARLVQLAFLVTASAAALAILPSRRLRGWLRVTLSKHLFQHRYDYRAEWLRFTDTIGRAGATAAPLRERIVQAVADITDSPSGLLLIPREDGGLTLDARWQWPGIDVPAEAMNPEGVRFFEQSQFILDLDDLRHDRVEGIPASAVPSWLMSEPAAWALVPLLHYERLVGVVVLTRPPVARQLDWEDFDLLRVVGRQLASYLAEQASQDALGDAQRFEEFNRRFAFVMHDIKNLASQLSLLARNAERHADKPEFRADMLVTLRNSSDKLQALLTRLGGYASHRGETRESVKARELLSRVAISFAGRGDVVCVDRGPCTIMADREGLEQALAHLVQNALDASGPDEPVFLDLRREGDRAVIEIIDSGSGMSPEFIRMQLFKPFHSSKPDGFGIGAFEARELVRAMGGSLDVESREGLGSRFLLRLPLADSEIGADPRGPRRNEVA